MAIVGIHTPELPQEHDRAQVARHVAQNSLEFPHLLDNDYRYWNAVGNQYWPTLYLLDRCGRIRARAIGEVHAGEASGRRMESQIEALLVEDAAACAN